MTAVAGDPDVVRAAPGDDPAGEPPAGRDPAVPDASAVCLCCGCRVTPIFTRRAGEEHTICPACGAEDVFTLEAGDDRGD